MNNREIKVSVKDIPEVIEQLRQAEEKINNLQSKIDKAVETIKYYASEDDDCGKIYNDEEKELLDIFKESKELNNTFEIPEFKGTMKQLDDLCNIRKEGK